VENLYIIGSVRTIYAMKDLPLSGSLDSAWNNIRGGENCTFGITGSYAYSQVSTGTVFGSEPLKGIIARCLCMFDTSALPNNAVVHSAIFGTCMGASDNMDVPSDYTAVSVDYSGLLTDVTVSNFISFGAPISVDTLWNPINTVTFGQFIIDESWLGNINTFGNTVIGLRECTYDIGSAVPTHTEIDGMPWQEWHSTTQIAPDLYIQYTVPDTRRGQVIFFNDL